MNDKEILNSIRNILEERTLKFNDGKPGKADEQYMNCISSLELIISTEEAKTQVVVEELLSAINEFRKHTNLGIVKNGVFSEISPAICARNDIIEGRIISGKKYPVLSKEKAVKCLETRTELPPNCAWHDDSIIHISYLVHMYPESLLVITDEEIKLLGLEELKKDYLMRKENNV